MKAKRLATRLLILLGIAACFELFLYMNKEEKAGAPAEVAHVHQQAPTLSVQHSLQQDDLHLQLAVTNFSFSLEHMGKENKQGEGHVHLYLDGKKVAKIFEPQFVLKDIAAGKHDVMVELAHNNHESYGVQERFQIEVKP